MNKKWTPSEMGRKGGKKSRRELSSEQAREMVRLREEKKTGIKKRVRFKQLSLKLKPKESE